MGMEKMSLGGCVLKCFMLSSLPCFLDFYYSAIPTSCLMLLLQTTATIH